MGIGVAPITQLRTCVMKNSSLMWKKWVSILKVTALKGKISLPMEEVPIRKKTQLKIIIVDWFSPFNRLSAY